MKAKTPYKKNRKRIGRGAGSGHGKTSTRGHKGQLARSGNGKKPGFEGGQLVLYRRLPKRGFNATFKKSYSIVNLNQIANTKETEIDPQKALRIRLISRLKDGFKILGDGNLKKAVQIKAHAFSKSAKEKIEKAGGKAVLINN
jgi:large subunit ribosomal protein L15